MRKPLPLQHPDFDSLCSLEAALLVAAGGEAAFDVKMTAFFRSAIDEVIDTGRTGRKFLHELEKTEKTYLGTKFEINLREWLGLPKGDILDLNINGSEVDIKSSVSGWNWGIPQEAFDHFCILLNVDDRHSKYSFGLILAAPDRLSSGSNRDKKKRITAITRGSHVWWIRYCADYTCNFWTRITEAHRELIIGLGGKAGLALLFESYQGLPVSRVQISAIAQQDDPMRRIRRNGGARDILAPKGIAILYEGKDRVLLARLGIMLGKREFISFSPRNASERLILKEAGHID